MRYIKFILVGLLSTLIVVGCTTEDGLTDDNTTTDNSGSSSGSSDSTTTVGEEVIAPSSDDYLSKYTFASTMKIVWDGSSATISNIPDSVTVTSNSSGNVILTSITSKYICYQVSGSGSGSLKIYSDHLYEISMNGLSLTSASGPAFNFQSHKRAFIVPEKGTVNTLIDSSNYPTSTEDQKGTLFAEGQLIFAGSGSLNVKGNYKHAICSDDYIVGMSGNINVTGAASDAIHTNSYVILQNGTWNLTSIEEGVQAEEGNICINGGSLTSTTTGDKAHSISAVGNFRQTAGSLISSVSGAGSKCIKADGDVNISAGTFQLTTTGGVYVVSTSDVSSACGINCDGDLNITGGTFIITSSGQAGKCISVDGTATFGDTVNGPIITATTSGSAYGTSSSGMGFGGTSSSSDTSKAKAIKSEGAMVINDGVFTIKTSTSEAEGIESKTSLTINGGELVITTYDDAINSSGMITINGGNIYAYATNNDAIDSNYGKSGAITIEGGVIMAQGTSSPEEGLDADSPSYVTIKGGTVFSSGGSQGGSGSPTCSQPVVLISGSLSSGYFTVADSNGTVIFACKVPRSMSSNYSYVTSPSFKSGSTYKYGVSSSVPNSYTSNWGTYYYEGGSSSISSWSSFTCGSGYTSTGSTTSGGGGFGR